MKIKNFKLNKKMVSKLAACVLVGSLATTTLTGCSNKKKEISRSNILSGTILESALVITFGDGSKDVAIDVGNCGLLIKKYNHYYSIISGKYFSHESCWHERIEGNRLSHYNIVNEEFIDNYLTSEELTKAIKGELNDDDISYIISRTTNRISEDENTKKYN